MAPAILCKFLAFYSLRLFGLEYVHIVLLFLELVAHILPMLGFVKISTKTKSNNISLFRFRISEMIFIIYVCLGFLFALILYILIHYIPYFITVILKYLNLESIGFDNSRTFILSLEDMGFFWAVFIALLFTRISLIFAIIITETSFNPFQSWQLTSGAGFRIFAVYVFVLFVPASAFMYVWIGGAQTFLSKYLGYDVAQMIDIGATSFISAVTFSAIGLIYSFVTQSRGVYAEPGHFAPSSQ